MRKLWGSNVKIRQTILAALFCCALLGVGAGHFTGADSSDQHVMRLFAQDEDASQPESPLDAAELEAAESRASQPESPLEPKDGDAAAQPDSPLEKPDDEPEPEEVEPTATEAPTKTPEPTATDPATAPPTVAPTTPAPTATALPTATLPPTTSPTVAPTVNVVPELKESTQLSVTEQVTITTQLPLIASSGQDQSGSGLTESGENVMVQVGSQPVGSQPVQVVPIEVSDLLSLLVSSGTNPLFLTENLILALLCLVGFSITWLGLCALSVCLFYIRSRQSSYIRDYAGADRHMVVHYRR